MACASTPTLSTLQCQKKIQDGVSWPNTTHNQILNITWLRLLAESESALSLYICERIQGVAPTEYEKVRIRMNSQLTRTQKINPRTTRKPCSELLNTVSRNLGSGILTFYSVQQSAIRHTTISNINDVLIEDPMKHAPIAHPKNPEISIFAT
ncbi:hypothetical protein I7I53_02801 [Histoplasma capsulatum var. duboisii H88]|uniref:Uncharacterized protein n=1 Tax=Ajellomyces capsulatus (strain H88) TaxID=544711 RepID=A0A8A1LL23_AJEC8|nr:hypothetical protein I7I53_02801 [Histoplasma capsulatum var. duboisii H88]